MCDHIFKHGQKRDTMCNKPIKSDNKCCTHSTLRKQRNLTALDNYIQQNKHKQYTYTSATGEVRTVGFRSTADLRKKHIQYKELPIPQPQ